MSKTKNLTGVLENSTSQNSKSDPIIDKKMQRARILLKKTKQKRENQEGRLALPYVKNSYLVRVNEVVVIGTSKDKYISGLE